MQLVDDSIAPSHVLTRCVGRLNTPQVKEWGSHPLALQTATWDARASPSAANKMIAKAMRQMIAADKNNNLKQQLC
jgi:hypothetical protein